MSDMLGLNKNDLKKLTARQGLRKRIYGKISLERTQQESKWGIQRHNLSDWLAILTEEIGEIAKAILENKFRDGDIEDVKKELIHAAAVIVSILECIETGKASVFK